ncbi:hypothetical protein IQ274_02750 [Nostoc sp. LEGE 12447]|uniref:hypothetical protein n=1 Tax=Nostoc sp. LEGE 12447 TaxID=1828640 RepID=UPI00188133EC|nr:hypothetical protein [Nostoc sp. LEGE 12447]MBE8997161.1 hypothetical protein [Nostoc sp. LEGE 12447]
MFQFNLEMNERSPFANEHENRTAKDAKGAKEERRRSDRYLKLQLMAIAAKISTTTVVWYQFGVILG